MKPGLRALVLFTAGSIICGFAHSGEAQRIQGFEPGDPAVTSTGDAGSKQAFQGVPPPEGANHYLVTTINQNGQDGTDGFFNQSGTNAVPGPTIEAFFGNAVSIVGTEGSAFRINNIVLLAGQIIRFSFDFLTNELPPFPGDPNPNNDPFGHLDLAFALLINSNGTAVGGLRTIADPRSVDFNSSSSLLTGLPFNFHTGYRTFEITVATSGTYSLGIGVIDRTTSDTPSGLLIDNIQIVPEPSSIALAFAGSVLLVGILRRKAQPA
jgi:hypothetical protein